CYVEWSPGAPGPDERRLVVTEVDEATGAILARNDYNTEFRGRTAVWHVADRVRSYTCDRGEFVGRNRLLSRPAALQRPQLGGRYGAGLDPCGALHVEVTLAPGETRQLAFVLGQGKDRAHALDLARRYGSLHLASATFDRAERAWDDTLNAIQVRTPDDSFDLIVNRWLLYQSLSCRIWARSGPYQPGGAFGFRDPLQDVLALPPTRRNSIRPNRRRTSCRGCRRSARRCSSTRRARFAARAASACTDCRSSDRETGTTA